MNNIFLNLNLDKFLLACYSREHIKVLMGLGLGLELGVETSRWWKSNNIKFSSDTNLMHNMV